MRPIFAARAPCEVCDIPGGNNRLTPPQAIALYVKKNPFLKLCPCPTRTAPAPHITTSTMTNIYSTLFYIGPPLKRGCQIHHGVLWLITHLNL